MSATKNVVLAGASGNLGPHILKVLLTSQSLNVTVLSREGSTSTFPSGVKVVRVDYTSEESLKAALQGQDAVISLVGHGLDDQRKLIDASIAAGVKQFIPSEFGSNTIDPEALQRVPIFKGKVDTVKYLQSKESEISWTAVICGPFFDWCILTGFFLLDQKTKTANLIDDGETVFSATTVQQIGQAVTKIVEEPSLTKNQYVFISSFETSQKEILKSAEKITGEKWTVNNVTSQSLYEKGMNSLKSGDFYGALSMIQANMCDRKALNDFRAAGLSNEKLGLAKVDFEESVKRGLQGQL